ncbi:MAG: type II toxin-antitoxin system HipA family toxin [Enterobacterales bacterium]|nr:type II toxin-antitoxin system HipA family toxin [Enterobacterales bacterium]
MKQQTLSVYYQNEEVAVLSYDLEKLIGYFEYTPAFVSKQIQLSPLKMPAIANKIYRFPNLNPATFKGLPGMVADSLPDRFGNAILDQWFVRQGRQSSITPLERLQYTGTRGMGALEYKPSTQLKSLNAFQSVEIAELVSVAQSVLDQRKDFQLNITQKHIEIEAMRSLLAVGTSAGGARAKAVLAFNQDFSQVCSGQASIREGFTHYLMKFDGVVENSTNEETFGDPLGYGVMEYVYYLMAKQCGIDMMFCDLLHESNRRHFITKRFDREGNHKIHVQTLTAMAHVDYHTPGSFSYEQLFAVARKLKLPISDAKQLFLRMAFNLMAQNNDDHAKNFAFYLKDNRWRLTPAYDIAYCFKPGNLWIEQHWMSANGKRKNHRREDIISVGRNSTKLPISEMNKIIDRVIESLSNWDRLANEYEVPSLLRKSISKNLSIINFM